MVTHLGDESTEEQIKNVEEQLEALKAVRGRQKEKDRLGGEEQSLDSKDSRSKTRMKKRLHCRRFSMQFDTRRTTRRTA